MSEQIKFDRLELVLKSFHNFLLQEPNKLGGKVYNFGKDLTL